MTEKDNIKLKTDTLTSRKNNSPVGVHVKRKRKIITQTSTAQSDPSSKITKKDSKKEIIKDSASQNIKTNTKLSQAVENQTSDPKASKKHKIDKDEKIERMENKELHLKSPSSKKGKNKKNQTQLHDIQTTHKFEKPTEPVKRDVKITQSMTVAELANQMALKHTDLITKMMSLGVMATVNQSLDQDTAVLITEELGHTAIVVQDTEDEITVPEKIKITDGKNRAPIVTIMGHVDHGKTSLMDYIRNSNVIAGESGGITQHIGAYEVTLDDGQKISFLDTPGHAAFTAMRARGAKVTDIVIIVVAADDRVMPQTKEAISHAQAAGVPIIFAINKIDLLNSDPEKIKGELAEINMLVEDWGGKYQSNDISAKEGTGVQDLLEKVLLESEMLDLKANPNRNAQGTVVEASLDKGKGFLSTILVQKGTLKVGDYVLAGRCSGKVKALLDERGNKKEIAGPSTPVVILGLDGAPTAGDEFYVMDSEQDAKKIAAKRMQLQREQSVRTQKHLTLDEIGRRIAIGEFQEVNIIVKGDVDGSIEALSDSLEGLSNEEIKVNIIQKAVGQISESDVMLAAASDAIIIGFQVRPSLQARKLAETENIDIRLYSIIYKAIEDLKLAMEGMLSPDVEEKIICNVEVRETFKISKVGTIAGCMVTDGTITRKSKVRLIRDGVVVYSGQLSTLKRFKEDVGEVKKGFECGMSIENFNDIKVGDIIEGYDNVEIKRELN